MADHAASPTSRVTAAGGAASWSARIFASLGVAEYRWFFFGQGVSLVGSWVRSAAQAWLVYVLTGSKVALGAVAAVSQLPLVLAPVAGTLADRLDKRRLLMTLAGFAMALSLLLAWLTTSGRVQTWHIMLIAGLAGLEMAVEIPARQSYVVEMVGRRHLQNAIALNSAMFNAARMLGPAVAGLLMGAFSGVGEGAPTPAHAAALGGIGLCFLVDALSFLAVLLALSRIRTLPARAEPEPGGWRARLGAGFAYVRQDRRTRVLLTLLGVAVLFGWSYLAMMAAFAHEVLGLEAGGYGLLMSASGVGAALGALWVAGRPEAPSQAVSRRRVFGSLWLFSAMVIVFSQMRAFGPAALAVALAGFGAVAFASTGNTLIQLAVPDHLRGRVMGIWALVFGGSMPLGSWLLGHVAERTGTATAIALSGTAGLLASALVYRRLPPLAEPVPG